MLTGEWEILLEGFEYTGKDLPQAKLPQHIGTFSKIRAVYNYGYISCNDMFDLTNSDNAWQTCNS